jgi:glycosyltransferase involved in cell wall biosynthesis
VSDRPQRPDAETIRLADEAGGRAERDERRVDVPRERPAELERVALAAAENPRGPEGGRRDVDDPHLVLALVTLGDPGKLTGGYLYHRRVAEAAAEHGARVAFVSFPEAPFPLPTLAAPRALAPARRLGAHAVLLDSIAAALAAPWLRLRPPDLPVVAVVHQPPGGMDHGRVRASVQAPLDRAAYARSAGVIAASDLLAGQLAAAGVACERIRVVPPGRDVPGPPPGAAPPDLRAGRQAAFLCAANWIERKGIVDLLEAFAALPAEVAVLHLAGDDRADPRYADAVRRRLAGADLAGRVVVHGPVSREEIGALYQAADVFVLAATAEPYGTVYGEAMAAGLPVVGWRAGNLPFLADDGVEGLVVDPGDVAGLSRALAVLAGDGDLRRRLGEAAHARALTRPNWDEAAALFFAAVRDALARWPEQAAGA